jgi:hypothetical protein
LDIHYIFFPGPAQYKNTGPRPRWAAAAGAAFKKIGEKYGLPGLGKKEIIDKYGT